VNRPQIRLATIVSIPFEENAYVAQLEGRSDCLVIDPGLEPEKILDYLDGRRLVPAAILNTHGHSDHVGGNAALKARWPDCPLVIGSADAPKLTDPLLNLSAVFGGDLVSPPADVTVNDGDTYSAAGFELRVLAIPGHSAGHVVYLWQDHHPPLAFVGDVIFAGSIGRTDFPDGDFRQLQAGIHAKLFTLPEETQLLTGHGEPTTVGQEKRYNPFVGLERGSGGRW
jgi:hydroxyacylglutathione hydrolase